MTERIPNALISESSPYLLQHAYNPVRWMPWSNEAFELARKADKPVLISIGYSSCHWCHVMEKESFEDEETAAIMNLHFICIKVDREERPDVDAIYMDAVQLMTGRGGWPLNCFVMPDQKPFYGGTYFPRAHWQKLLLNISRFYREQKEQCVKYAEELTTGLNRFDMVASDQQPATHDFEDIYKVFASGFDTVDGGMNRVPKFPMPSNWAYLLQYYYHTGKDALKQQLELTLHKMADGGINDQLGGGFARYATDAQWKVPHFEKMLYDNAQLMDLYANAFKLTGDDYYKNVVNDIHTFVSREMTSDEGGFYSALDADSEGMEGRYYIWTDEELKIIPEQYLNLFRDAYKLHEKELWEDDFYILQRAEVDLMSKYGKSSVELNQIIRDVKSILLDARSRRIRPQLDDKQLCSWNAMMLTGYINAYEATGIQEYFTCAFNNAVFIEKRYLNNKKLFHSCKDGRSVINGYLEDYAFVIQAFIRLYQCSGNEKWMDHASDLTETVFTEFTDTANPLFYFTSSESEQLITRKKELQDNVISSSNAVMCTNLFLLGKLTSNSEWSAYAEQMLQFMYEPVQKSGPWYAHWAQCALMMSQPFFEVVICGEDAASYYSQLSTYYLPDCLIVYSTMQNDSNLIFRGRWQQGKTGIYICVNNACQQPVYSVIEAYNLLTGARDKM